MATEQEKIEYRIRPVTRWIVTRYFHSEEVGDGARYSCGGCDEKGEFDSAHSAYEVAFALCKLEHQNKGWPVGDERLVYPQQPKD